MDLICSVHLVERDIRYVWWGKTLVPITFTNCWSLSVYVCITQCQYYVDDVGCLINNSYPVQSALGIFKVFLYTHPHLSITDLEPNGKRICNTTQQTYWQILTHEYEFNRVCMTKAFNWSQLHDSDQKVCTKLKSLATQIMFLFIYMYLKILNIKGLEIPECRGNSGLRINCLGQHRYLKPMTMEHLSASI